VEREDSTTEALTTTGEEREEKEDTTQGLPPSAILLHTATDVTAAHLPEATMEAKAAREDTTADTTEAKEERVDTTAVTTPTAEVTVRSTELAHGNKHRL